ncbi:Ovarian tumor suppressor candidate 2 [Fasciola hepatica]|uniref:Ovarian tumor suppressor candidate 2 n=1 Tax=Fasciola hepatica TaxID=6192 RepID=A0A4E0R4K5_FASHE|nr:Ovarian tumor suppressor candidate 2 [Fasciola hepatica]
MAKLRILCIHGYRQNADLFREKTGAFRKKLKKSCDFVFFTAPNMIGPDSGNGWWFSGPDNHFKAQDDSDYDRGFVESLEALKHVIKQEEPFDGILAFSQGAAFMLMVQLLLKSGQFVCETFQPKFSILVAPFLSRSRQHLPLFEHKTDIPTLVVYGRADEVIPEGMSRETLPLFEPPATVFVHNGGHHIPTDLDAKVAYQEFLLRFSDNSVT